MAETALARLDAEFVLSKAELVTGGKLSKEQDILNTWSKYYEKVYQSISDIEPSAKSSFDPLVATTVAELKAKTAELLKELK